MIGVIIVEPKKAKIIIDEVIITLPVISGTDCLGIGTTILDDVYPNNINLNINQDNSIIVSEY